MTEVVVVGASGFGRESLDVLEAMQRAGSSVRVLGVADDNPSSQNLERLRIRGVPYLGPIDSVLSGDRPNLRYVLAIGHTSVRRQLVTILDQRGLVAFNAIHPLSIMGSGFVHDGGIVACAGASVGTNVSCGRHVHINPNATIGHDSNLGDFVSVNPGAIISGEVEIRDGCLIGAGAIVLQQLTVGGECTIGAGSVLTKSAPSGATVVGVPGRWN